MPANGSSDDYVPVKIAQDPPTTGSSRDLYVLFGLDNTSDVTKTRHRELWRSQTNGTYFSKVSDGSGPAYPIDFAIYPDGSQLVVSASDQGGDPQDVATGTTWVYKTSGTWLQTWPWSYDPGNPPGSPDLSKLTGAVWTDGTKEYLLKVDKNTGSAGTPAPPRCVPADISRYAGVWWRGTQDTSVWRRSDNGSTWELGWTSCQLARGKINNGIAKSLSKMGTIGASGDGPYFNTMQFFWRYDASQTKFFGEFTNGDWGGTQYNTLRLDNANAATVEAPDDSAVWAGYYDIGLWKYNGVGWENHNQDLTEWGSKMRQRERNLRSRQCARGNRCRLEQGQQLASVQVDRHRLDVFRGRQRPSGCRRNVRQGVPPQPDERSPNGEVVGCRGLPHVVWLDRGSPLLDRQRLQLVVRPQRASEHWHHGDQGLQRNAAGRRVAGLA
jgi:hypothetical protein